MQKPFLKWAGNKARIAKRLHKALPSAERLIEPFLGSGAVFLANHAKYENFLLGDVNQDLVSLFRILVKDADAFIEEARALFVPETNTKERYYEFRDELNSLEPGDRRRAALFLYLNRHGFNGLCRYNQSGGFNVPFGRYKKPYFPEKQMRAFARIGKQAEFRCEDFRTLMAEAGEGDVVYCDPPYVPLSASASFTSYASDGFGIEEQQALAEAAEAAMKRGAVVILSNHATPVTAELYKHARRIERFKVARFISANGSREKAAELLAFFAPADMDLPEVFETEKPAVQLDLLRSPEEAGQKG